MKKLVWGLVMVALFATSVGAGYLARSVFSERAAVQAAKQSGNYESPEITLPEKIKPGTGGNGAGDNQQDDTGNDGANNGPGQSEPGQPGSGGSGQPGAGQPGIEEKTVYSWWFTRNTVHKPTGTSSQFLDLIRGRGFYLGDSSKKRVYLTFDEGYENGYTPQILDVLKANHVQAAFFVTEDFIDSNPGLVKRMASEGHLLGNHTATHPSMPLITSDEIRRELKIVKDKIYSMTGQTTHFMRPPKGDFNSRVLDVARQEGYSTVFWSMAYKDWDTANQPGREAALKHVKDNVHPGAVILLHTVSKSNAEALDDIIKNIYGQGYSFGSLEELK